MSLKKHRDGWTETHAEPSAAAMARSAERLRRYFDARPEVRLCSASTRVLASITLARLAAAGLGK